MKPKAGGGGGASYEAVWQKVFQAKERATCKGPEAGVNFCVEGRQSGWCKTGAPEESMRSERWLGPGSQEALLVPVDVGFRAK